MAFTLYGIKNCDTVKKARQWLEQHHVEFRFHDFRSDGLDRERVDAWLAELGADTLINRRGTTFRVLDEAAREQLAQDPAPLLVAQPALIKRPVLDLGHERVVGFSADRYQQLFKTHTL
jgi:arsenate reductase